MSKLGYRLLIHNSIPEDVREKCREWLHKNILSRPRGEEFKSRRESCAFYRRGRLGLSLDIRDDGELWACNKVTARFTFRRVSNNRRIYAIMPIDLLERIDGKPVDMNTCICGYHRGGQRVRIKGEFFEEDFEVFAEVGDIKG